MRTEDLEVEMRALADLGQDLFAELVDARVSPLASHCRSAVS
jgi:hypothetical protein